MQYFLCHRWTSTYGTWERSKHVKAVEAIGDGASIHQIHDLNNVLQSLKKITLQQASKISKRAYSSKKHRTCFFFQLQIWWCLTSIQVMSAKEINPTPTSLCTRAGLVAVWRLFWRLVPMLGAWPMFGRSFHHGKCAWTKKESFCCGGAWVCFLNSLMQRRNQFWSQFIDYCKCSNF